jgi:hypothetical protein
MPCRLKQYPSLAGNVLCLVSQVPADPSGKTGSSIPPILEEFHLAIEELEGFSCLNGEI